MRMDSSCSEALHIEHLMFFSLHCTVTPPRREGGGQRSALIESRHDLGETEEDEDKYTGERERR